VNNESASAITSTAFGISNLSGGTEGLRTFHYRFYDEAMVLVPGTQRKHTTAAPVAPNAAACPIRQLPFKFKPLARTPQTIKRPKRSGSGWTKGNKSMSDKAEGAVADAGARVQKKLNQAGDVQDQLVQFIRDNPISAALVFVGIGYVLGKII
jgi:hypothetical protein